jgi:type IV pilus assembly protein PilO
MQFGLRTLMFVVLLLGMLMISYWMLFKPAKEAREAAINETKQKQEDLNKLAGAMQRTKDMTQEIENLQIAIKFLRSKLPQEQEMDKVLNEIWQAAKENNLNIKSVRNAKPVTGENYSEQPIRMVVEGTFYPGFFKFLSQVEQMPRLTKINEMKIEADNQNNGHITADLVLTIYYESSTKVAVVP